MVQVTKLHVAFRHAEVENGASGKPAKNLGWVPDCCWDLARNWVSTIGFDLLGFFSVFMWPFRGDWWLGLFDA